MRDFIECEDSKQRVRGRELDVPSEVLATTLPITAPRVLDCSQMVSSQPLRCVFAYFSTFFNVIGLQNCMSFPSTTLAFLDSQVYDSYLPQQHTLKMISVGDVTHKPRSDDTSLDLQPILFIVFSVFLAS